MQNKLETAETKFPSFLKMNEKSRSDINKLIYNIRGNMSDFNVKTDELANNYMKVQSYLIGVDEPFKQAASDGGSIFSKDGVAIPKDVWVSRYIDKWTHISRTEIPGVNDPLVSGDYSNLNMGHFGTTPSTVTGDYTFSGDMEPQLTGWQADSIAGTTPGDLNMDGWNPLGGRYWQIPAGGGSMQDMWGNQFYAPPDIQTSKMQEDAEKYYDVMYNKVNETMTKNDKNAKEFGFNLEADLSGMPKTIGSDMYLSAQHQYTFDENKSDEVNGSAVDFANQIYKILDGDASSYSVIAGGDYIASDGTKLGVQNPEMVEFLEQAYLELTSTYGKGKADGGGAPKTDGLVFDVTYSTNMGGSEVDAAGYEFHFSYPYASKKIGSIDKATGVNTKGIVSKAKSEKFLEDFTITVLVEKELDKNSYRVGDREQRWVMNELKANEGRITRVIPGGGQISVYQVSPGQYMFTDAFWQIKDGEKTLVQNLNLQIPQYRISEILQTQEAALQQIASSNLDLIESYNISNNFIE